MAGNGKASPRIVQSIDIYPTLAELCGLPAPGGVEGRSLLSLLRDPGATWDHPAYTVWSEDGRVLTGISVRTERWRYAEYFGTGAGALLLDSEKDPHEIRNVVEDSHNAVARAQLAALVEAYRARFATAEAPSPR